MIVEESKPKSVIIHMDRFSLSKDLQLEAIEEFKVVYSADISFRDVADKINAFYSKNA